MKTNMINTIVRVPYKTGETAVLNVKLNKKTTDIVEIAGKVMKKGKEVGKMNYHNKKGFDNNRLAVIVEEIEQKAIEGYDFISQVIRIINGNKKI